MKYGRVDVSGPTDCPEEGRLPGKNPFIILVTSGSCLCLEVRGNITSGAKLARVLL